MQHKCRPINNIIPGNSTALHHAIHYWRPCYLPGKGRRIQRDRLRRKAFTNIHILNPVTLGPVEHYKRKRNTKLNTAHCRKGMTEYDIHHNKRDVTDRFRISEILFIAQHFYAAAEKVISFSLCLVRNQKNVLAANNTTWPEGDADSPKALSLPIARGNARPKPLCASLLIAFWFSLSDPATAAGASFPRPLLLCHTNKASIKEVWGGGHLLPPTKPGTRD